MNKQQPSNIAKILLNLAPHATVQDLMDVEKLIEQYASFRAAEAVKIKTARLYQDINKILDNLKEKK